MGDPTRRDFLHEAAGSAALVPALGALSTTAFSALSAQGAAGEGAKKKIKIGQIGVGHAHAGGNIEALRKSPDFEVVGVVESDDALRAEAMKSPKYADLPWMSTEQLLNLPGLQAVAVETRVRDLLDAAEACVAAGKHIHLDKPAGASLPQFRRILENADRQKLVVQMGYMYRYNPAVLLLKEVLSQGWLGDIFEVHAVMSKVVDKDSRLRLGEFPGGMMFELGGHLIDLVVGILGRPESVTPFIQHAATIDDALDDNTLAVLTYPRALATVKSSAMEVDGFDRRRLSVCGTEGSFHIEPLDAPNCLVTFTGPRGKFKAGYQRVEFGEYERYVGDVTDLAQTIRGEKKFGYPSSHDLAVQESLLKACGQSTT